MATPTKAQILNEVLALLDAEVGRLGDRVGIVETTLPEDTPVGRLPVLDAMLLGICRENAGHRAALKAVQRLKSDFFDLNEVRVSRVADLVEVLDLPEAEARARIILRLLKQVFNHIIKTGDRARLEVVLDVLGKKPQKEALKALERFEAFTQSDHVQATVIQSALGGHALPLDAVTRGVLERLEVLDPGLEPPVARGQLERLVPKARGGEFLLRLEMLAGRFPGVELDVERLRVEVRRRLGLPEAAAQLAVSPASTMESEAGTSSSPVAKASGSRSSRARGKSSASNTSSATAAAPPSGETTSDPSASPNNHQTPLPAAEASKTAATTSLPPSEPSAPSRSSRAKIKVPPASETDAEQPQNENGPPSLRKSQNAKRPNDNAPAVPPLANGSPPPRSKRSRKS